MDLNTWNASRRYSIFDQLISMHVHLFLFKPIPNAKRATMYTWKKKDFQYDHSWIVCNLELTLHFVVVKKIEFHLYRGVPTKELFSPGSKIFPFEQQPTPARIWWKLYFQHEKYCQNTEITTLSSKIPPFTGFIKIAFFWRPVPEKRQKQYPQRMECSLQTNMLSTTIVSDANGPHMKRICQDPVCWFSMKGNWVITSCWWECRAYDTKLIAWTYSQQNDYDHC